MGIATLKATPTIKRFAAWIGIIAYLVLTLAGFKDMVFCHEQNGTIKLETALNGVCADSFQAFHSDGKTSEQISECSRCFDQPVHLVSLAPSGAFNVPFDSLEQALSPGESPPIILGYLHTASTNVLAQPPPRRPAVHRYLKPVILVI